MKTNVVLIIALLATANICPATPPPPGATVLKEMDWARLPLPAGATRSQAGEEGKATLLIKRSESSPKTYPLLVLDKPGVKTKAYAWSGKIRYQSVQGVGYLETWNQFPSAQAGQRAQRFFSRGLADVGPFSKITGGSGWRSLLIPFNADGAKDAVERIEMNLVLPGPGEVEISNLELLEFADANAMFSALGAGSALPSFGLGLMPFIVQIIIAFAVLCLLAVVAFVLITKRRKAAEQRRMKAMDAM
jgi:cbb3-type cytochrome oxidase subunit 3